MPDNPDKSASDNMSEHEKSSKKSGSGRKEAVLVVDELRHRDAVGGKVKIDISVMKELDLEPGDIVEIEGRKKTAGIVWPSYGEDDPRIIKMDPIVRRNADVAVGEKVIIRKAFAQPAKFVKIAPSQSGTAITSVDQSFISFIKKRLDRHPVVEGDVIYIPILGQPISFVVVQTKPSGVVYISGDTQLRILEKPVQLSRLTKVTYNDIGGMKDIIMKVRELVELPLKYPEIFRRLGIDPPKGILLYGPPGVGKTLLAKALANEVGAYFIAINGPEIMSKFYGESEQRLREIFEEARKNAPAIIFIDEIDAIAPKRDEVVGEVERRVVAQLLTLMDGLQGRGDVIVIGATNRLHAVDPALRRPGRFDREIEIPLPDKNGRLEILQIHTRNVPLAEDVDLERLAEMTHGFTGADLAALVKEAALRTIRRSINIEDLDKESVDLSILESLKVSMNDFLEAYKEIIPSGLREVHIEIPEVRWSDIGGLDEVKQELRESIEWAIKTPHIYKRLGIDPPKGILLYGPPGVGKTLLAKALANESGAHMIWVKGPELLSKWVGESERAIREIFRKARLYSPAIVFFDEIDALFPVRGIHEGSHVMESIVSQLLAEIDGIESMRNVFIIGATNRPDLIDPALFRPGRFDKLIYVPPPDYNSRIEILKVHTRKMPLAEDVDLEYIARATEGYSGADLAAVVREAGLAALRENINAEKVEMRHFIKALEKIRPSLTDEIIRFYEMWGSKARQNLPRKTPVSSLMYS